MPSVPELITESVLKQLEQGVAPWRKPWSRYRGLNVFLLATHGYGSPYWLTFNQASQLGAHVRQGEKSTLVSFWKFSEYAKENRETGQTENKTSVLLRYYRVFNIEQCVGLRTHFRIGGLWSFPRSDYSKEELVAEMGAAMLGEIAGISQAPLTNSASYLQSWINRLKSDSRLILTHSTGHKSRLISAASHAQKAADYILGKTLAEGSQCQ